MTHFHISRKISYILVSVALKFCYKEGNIRLYLIQLTYKLSIEMEVLNKNHEYIKIMILEI